MSTNYDMLRSMTPEEMARERVLSFKSMMTPFYHTSDGNICMDYESAYQHELNWLLRESI